MTDLEQHLLRQLLGVIVEHNRVLALEVRQLRKEMRHMSANTDALEAAVADLKTNVIPAVEAEIDALKAAVPPAGEDVDAKLPPIIDAVNGIANDLKAIVAAAQA